MGGYWVECCFKAKEVAGSQQQVHLTSSCLWSYPNQHVISILKPPSDDCSSVSSGQELKKNYLEDIFHSFTKLLEFIKCPGSVCRSVLWLRLPSNSDSPFYLPTPCPTLIAHHILKFNPCLCSLAGLIPLKHGSHFLIFISWWPSSFLLGCNVQHKNKSFEICFVGFWTILDTN